MIRAPVSWTSAQARALQDAGKTLQKMTFQQTPLLWVAPTGPPNERSFQGDPEQRLKKRCGEPPGQGHFEKFKVVRGIAVSHTGARGDHKCVARSQRERRVPLGMQGHFAVQNEAK